MRSALIHGLLLTVMLVFGYRTWTRDKTVKPDLGTVVLWNKTESELASIEFKKENKTVRIERKTDGKDAYWWGTETSITKQPKPKPPEPKPAAGTPANPAGSGSAGSGSAAAGSGSAKPAAGSGSAVAAGSGSAVAAGSGSAAGSAKPQTPGSGSGSGSALAAGSGSAKGSAAGSGSAGSGSAIAAGSGSAGSGSGSAATPPAPPVEMVETTRRREFPLGDNGDKLIKAYTEARAVGELGKPTADQLVFFKLATKEQVDAKLTEVKKELDAIKAAEAEEKEKEKEKEKGEGGEGKDPKAKKPKKDDKKPELTKKIKDLEDQKKAAEKPRSQLTVTFADGSARTFHVGGSPTQGGSDRYMLDQQSGDVYVFSKDMIANLESGESALQLTDPRGFDATKIEQVEVDWNGRKKLAKRVQTADASDKQVKTWTDADTGKANQPLATFIDNVNNLRPTEYAKDVKVDSLSPVFRIEYRDATNGKLGTLSLYKIEKTPVIPDGVDFDPANPPKGEIEYYVLTERTRVPALVRRDPAKKSEEDLPIVFGDKAAPVAPKPGANPFGNVPIKGGGAGSAAPNPLGMPAPKGDGHGH